MRWLEELAQKVAAMTPGDWRFKWEGARQAEDSESAAVDAEGRKLFDTLNRDCQLSETSRLDDDDSGRWFDTGGNKDIEGVVLLRNNAERLIAGCLEAERLRAAAEVALAHLKEAEIHCPS
jgi:hypothetical protein